MRRDPIRHHLAPSSAVLRPRSSTLGFLRICSLNSLGVSRRVLEISRDCVDVPRYGLERGVKIDERVAKVATVAVDQAP